MSTRYGLEIDPTRRPGEATESVDWDVETRRDHRTAAWIVAAPNGSAIDRITDRSMAANSAWWLERRIALLLVDWRERESS